VGGGISNAKFSVENFIEVHQLLQDLIH